MSVDEFHRQIVQCLTHLYDTVFLETSPLASLPRVTNAGRRSRGRALRKEIGDAIESLRPPTGTPSDDVAWRPYRILEGRYLAGLSYTDMEGELHLGKSQYYREHSRALAALSSVLWHKWNLGEPAVDMQAQVMADPNALAVAELARLARQEPPDTVDVIELLRDLATLLAPHLHDQDITLDLSLASEPLMIRCSPSVLRQSLLLPVSRAISVLDQGIIRIEARLQANRVLIEIVAPESVRTVSLTDDRGVIRSFVEMAGGILSFEEARGSSSVRISFPALSGMRTALLVDNSQELADLFARYLEGEPWSLLHAGTVAQALEMCEEHPPTLILLDVLMPHQDGWALLRQLRSSPATAHIPVMICSVLNQPELALSLGAAGYLRKPVTQESLREALQRFWVGLEPQGPAPSEQL